MEVSTLILLGAAGGLLRGLLDVYTQFVNWQADRRAHRQLPAGHGCEAPRFQEYYDPIADPIAAVVHSAMGAGAAVLFGTTGQISGAYAALVVGMSAPMLLTQLGRVPSVIDAVTGGSQTGDASQVEAIPQSAPAARQPDPSHARGQVPSRVAADSGQTLREEGMS
ncbi:MULTISPECIES: hypothetical protein [unclassified Streptomyces]|uniref:hypothetical protein n=1 Tax=unclassified Streptomyces TaxID=2593676 RepID=UPI0027E324FE|nr:MULTISPECIES: hypothetical protein [unclassified Streptomyces]